MNKRQRKKRRVKALNLNRRRMAFLEETEGMLLDGVMRSSACKLYVRAMLRGLNYNCVMVQAGLIRPYVTLE